jgi:hypothetical protein
MEFDNINTKFSEIMNNRNKCANKKIDANRHTCVIFTGNIKKSIGILAIAYNMPVNSNNISKHAEMNAVDKLRGNKSINKNNKKKSINIFIGKDECKLSKPCINCINYIVDITVYKMYKIKNVYYTDSDGKINKTKVSKLCSGEKHVSKFYKENNNM